MNLPSVIEENVALLGAIERADRLPEHTASSLDPSHEVWTDGDVWFGDWGKWEKYD